MTDSTAKTHWIADLVRTLGRVETYKELTDVLLERAAELDLSTVWLFLKLPTDDEFLHMCAVSGTAAEFAATTFPAVPIVGDVMLEALCRGEGPFAFDDVQEVPGLRKDIVEALGNRALINAPTVSVDSSIGIIGAGTFFDEGPRTLTADGIDRWMQVVAVASTVVARIRLREQAEEHREMQRALADRQRLESLGLLAGGVAHDLNNLLMVVRASLEFLGEDALSEAQKADVEVATSAIVSAADLTRQLLALGRKSPLALDLVDAGEVLDGARTLLARLLPASIAIDYVPKPDAMMVRADRSSLEQVVLNLAINARDAMPDGGRITFEAEQVVINGEYRRAHPWAKPGRYALLTVTDTGFGMPPEVREQIFDPFFTTKPPDQGSGLGLAVVYGIVQQHLGMLHCYSEVGIGTTFKIYLPLAERAAESVGNKLDGAVPRGQERVLVVDDDDGVRRVIQRVLTRAGYATDGASNGVDALRMSDDKGYDLFIVDAVMPQMGGRATIEALRRRWPESKIILASGYGAEALPAAFLEDLGVPALPKPFDPDSLLRVVRATIDR